MSDTPPLDDEQPEVPEIQANSLYDESIRFDDESPGREPGQYSPRPGGNADEDFYQFHTPVKPGGGPLSGFEVNFDDHKESGFGGGAFDFGQPIGGVNGYSPNVGANSYDTNAFDNTASTPELAGLFALISKYQPPPLEMIPHFKPFLPDLVPSIGAIDAFIKVPRPDGEQDPLGLLVLDEPTIGCSNPQILRMHLREKFGVVGGSEGDGYIGFIEKPSLNTKALASFLESYDEMLRNRAAPNMTYSFKIPDIEELMQPWPDEMEQALESLPLPSAELDLTLEEYAKVVCALLDIPVKGNIVESLHLMFTLYQQFKECNYFTNGAAPSAGQEEEKMFV